MENVLSSWSVYFEGQFVDRKPNVCISFNEIWQTKPQFFVMRFETPCSTSFLRSSIFLYWLPISTSDRFLTELLPHTPECTANGKPMEKGVRSACLKQSSFLGWWCTWRSLWIFCTQNWLFTSTIFLTSVTLSVWLSMSRCVRKYSSGGGLLKSVKFL